MGTQLGGDIFEWKFKLEVMYPCLTPVKELNDSVNIRVGHRTRVHLYVPLVSLSSYVASYVPKRALSQYNTTLRCIVLLSVLCYCNFVKAKHYRLYKLRSYSQTSEIQFRYLLSPLKSYIAINGIGMDVKPQSVNRLINFISHLEVYHVV